MSPKLGTPPGFEELSGDLLGSPTAVSSALCILTVWGDCILTHTTSLFQDLPCMDHFTGICMKLIHMHMYRHKNYPRVRMSISPAPFNVDLLVLWYCAANKSGHIVKFAGRNCVSVCVRVGKKAAKTDAKGTRKKKFAFFFPRF